MNAVKMISVKPRYAMDFLDDEVEDYDPETDLEMDIGCTTVAISDNE